MDRLEVLKNMVAQNPNDSFSRYGLAMEYGNQGQLEKAIDEYRGLLAINPQYAAAYYHGGRALEKLGRTDEARQMFADGIEVTRKLGDMHTLGELQAAMDMLDLL